MADALSVGSFSHDLSNEILKCSEPHSFPKGSIILEPGMTLNGAYILRSGSVKLFRKFESGDRHLLYLLHGGRLCALSTLTGLLGEKTEILAEAETDVEFLVVPQDVANKWLVENDEWREVLLRDFFSGWNESMAMLDQVAFKPLQRRLEMYLAEHQGLSKRNIVHKSHAEIAAELNVSREAVSRVLKVMENQDDIHLGHGSIKVIHSKP
jgi:CRP/FNR family transcriptional regulator